MELHQTTTTTVFLMNESTTLQCQRIIRMMTMMTIAIIMTVAKLCLIGHMTNAKTSEVLERAKAILQSISKSLKIII